MVIQTPTFFRWSNRLKLIKLIGSSLPIVSRTLSSHHGRRFMSACMSQINICPYFPREDVFPVSYYLTFPLPPWFYGEAHLGKGRLVQSRWQKALWKRHFIWVSTVFSTKVLTLRLLMETGPPFYVVIRAARRSALAVQREYLHFLSYFKTLSNSPASGNELPTSALLIAVNQHIALLCVLYESRGGSSDFRLPTSNFWLPTSDFRLNTSYFKLQTLDLTKCELWVSDFWPFRLKAEWLDLRTSHFPLPTSAFRLLISHFPLPLSHFLLLTSDFRFPTSDFQLPTSDFQLPSSNFRLLTWLFY